MKKIFVVAAVIIGSRTHAQDSTRLMEEVTLTASKFSTKTTATGKWVTIITSEAIERAGSRDLSQVLTELGGVFINGFTSNPGKEKNIYLRGAKVDHTLITIDGVPVYDASGIGSNFDIRNISIDNVERIEILKGSQSSLYGSDAIAGVINIITKKNSGNKTPTVSHVMNYGSYNSFRSATSINGQHKWLGYQAGFTHLASDGFSEARNMKNDLPFEKDAFSQNNFNLQLNIQAGKKLTMQPFFRYSRFKGDLDLDATRDEKDFTNENKNMQAGIKNRLNVGKGSLSLLYQYVNTKRHYLDDSLYIDPFAYYIFDEERYSAHEHFSEAYLVYPFRNLKITTGIDFRASGTDHTTTEKNIFNPVLTTTPYGSDSIKQRQVGIYAAVNATIDQINFEAGGRLNHHSEYGSNFAFNLNPSWLIKKRLKLFTNVSSGYKTPGLYQLFSLYGNEKLQPETSLSIEAGLQFYSADQKHSVKAGYFNRVVKDVIAFIPTSNAPYAQYVNQDEQKDHGLELEASANLSGKLELKAMYQYVNGEITTKQSGKDTTYFNLLRRPKSNFNLIAGYQAMKNLYFSAQLNAAGKRKDIYFDPSSFQAIDISLKPYVLLNLSAEYGLPEKKIRLFADIRNVLNEDYMEIYGYATAGINFHGGIRIHL